MMNTHAIKIPPKRHSVLRFIDHIPSSIWNIMPRWMCRWYDRLADRVWRRFHVLKLSYGYGWSDVSNKILYANFDLLTEFVRKENPGEVIDWSSSQEDAAT
ncbi:MAG: hypothetical protein IPN90_07120 [Elusimicrobia bacterium]|nr:hypothetical protein [Elusimicrobiota bacterium]